jgi:glycosyltransferase involved in cell wall biosynthesis
MKISLLCPSRSRPGKAIGNLCDWFDRMTGDFDVEIILSLDSNDPQLDVYHNLNEAQDRVADIILVSENKSAVDAINAAAEKATGDIFIVVSDDTDCLPSWDEALVKIVEGKEDWILKCNDGNIQSWIITMPVMDRKYYQRFGYIYQPEYEHMFCDTELTAVADLLGKKIECDLVFKHLHYSVTKEAKDSVSEKADSTWAKGEALFLSRVKRNFDLIDYPGQIKSEEYLAWISSKI